MMQLLCNGVQLDLYDNASLQFKHTNPLFAFDKLECERTTQFKLPCTPTNDAVFSLARVPAYAGTGMMIQFTAQLIDGTLIKDGYLYIGSYDGTNYNAIFVTGELLGLKVLKDSGKLKDILSDTSATVVWSNDNVKDANSSAALNPFDILRYKSNDAPCLPSFDMGMIMDAAYFKLTGRHLSSYSAYYRLLPKSVEPLPKMSVSIQYAGTGVPYDESYEPAQYANTMSISAATDIIQQQDLVLLIGVGGATTEWRYVKLHQFVAKQTILMTFPSDFPDDYYLMSIKDPPNPEYNYLSDNWFLGGWSFHQKTGGGTESTGVPLRGRTVEIPSGTPFMILSDTAYEYQPAPLNWDGFRWVNATTYTYNFTGIVIEGKEVSVGDTIRAVDILPNLTLVELFKIYSYCVGQALMYDEVNGVTFDPLAFNTWTAKDITSKLQKRGEVKRTFGDYVQNNIVRFSSGDDVPVNQRITTDYTINNVNLEYEKDLAVIPFSEGSIDTDGTYTLARFDAEDLQKHILYADGIMRAGGSTFCVRITLPKNSGLQQLCDKCTQFKVSARMTLIEYEAIDPKTLIQVDGIRYVWTDKDWKDNTAQFTLAKV